MGTEIYGSVIDILAKYGPSDGIQMAIILDMPFEELSPVLERLVSRECIEIREEEIRQHQDYPVYGLPVLKFNWPFA